MNKKRLVSILLTMLMLSSLTFNFASVWAEGEAASESEQVAEATSNEKEASAQAEQKRVKIAMLQRVQALIRKS